MILILGSRGRLGAALLRLWGAEGIARPDLDVSDTDALRTFLRSRRYHTLVNCTGLTSLEQCEDEPALAEAVNVQAPGLMALESRRVGARMIHFSTDYVFDGTLDRPYTEGDEARPLSVYGHTKRHGEEAVLDASEHHLVVRVSWLFGPDKPSFVDMILRRALGGGPVEAVSDKTSCPTFSEDVAGWLEPFFESELPGGLYHACNFGACSWQEYGQVALDIARQLAWPLLQHSVRPVSLASIAGFRAVRPRQTAMDCTKLQGITGITCRPWQEALGSYLACLTPPRA
jgi:dTDP-4-dehydrorhamnose reductase